MAIALIYITFPDEAKANSICGQLIAERLVACANIFPITSSYFWKGDLQNDQEFVGIVKTLPELWPLLQTRVKSLHPYEVPCILKTEFEANDAYEKWILSSVDKPGDQP